MTATHESLESHQAGVRVRAATSFCPHLGPTARPCFPTPRTSKATRAVCVLLCFHLCSSRMVEQVQPDTHSRRALPRSRQLRKQNARGRGLLAVNMQARRLGAAQAPPAARSMAGVAHTADVHELSASSVLSNEWPPAGWL